MATRRRGARPCQTRIDLRERDLERRGQPKRRQRRADREVDEDDGEVQRCPRDPARECGPPPPGRGLEERRGGGAPTTHAELASPCGCMAVTDTFPTD